MSAHDSALVETECGLCHGTFGLARRRVREYRQRGEIPHCRVCSVLARVLERRPPADPTKFYVFWFEQFPPDALDEMLVEIFGAAAGSRSACVRRRELRSRLEPVAA